MYRFFDPQLFPHDLIAEYYRSITPSGYAELHHLFAGLGVDLVLLSKWLPLVLGLITTGYAFAVCMQILPIPIAGFLSTMLLNQALWMHDDIVAAVPRGFFYPLFLAFVYYLLQRSLLPCLLAIALQALFYPIVALISAGILLLRLLDWKDGKLGWSGDRSAYWFALSGVMVACVTVLPYAIASSQFGPSITAAEALTMPEYWAGGRIRYYDIPPISFWLDGRDSGLFAMLSPPQLFIAVLLPILLLLRSRFPLTQKLNQGVDILLQTVIVSVGLFLIAHALSFKLYFPSRYTFHTFQMVFALATGITLTIILDAAWDWATQSRSHLQRRQLLVRSTATIVSLALVFYPVSLKSFPKSLYVVGSVPDLYHFLQQQPKDSLIASLSDETDNLPTFAKRPILVGRRYALPFHIRYYNEFRQRANDLIQAQYSPDLNQVNQFIRHYGVKFWLLDRDAFSPTYIERNRWIMQYPAAATAIAQLRNGTVPGLSKLMQKCAVVRSQNLVLLQTQCIEAAQPR
jgi:hypothetical protein